MTFRWVLAAYWFAILAFTLVAALFVRPWPREYTAILLLYFVLHSILYGLIHVGLARYRGEIEFIFLPAVAAGLFACVRRFLPASGSAPMPSAPADRTSR